MPVICPTITATTPEEYRQQIEKVAGFAHRIQIDLTDGQFAPRQTVLPAEAWWPVGMQADVHLMYKKPLGAAKEVLAHQPNLVIVHAEAEGDVEEFVRLCRGAGTKPGIALLPQTTAESILGWLQMLDHVMIFSGNLGYQGGSYANLDLLAKAKVLKQAKPDLEIGWDGGIQPQNAAALVFGGVDVLNVGGFIQNSDDPLHSYKMLDRIADETGTT